MGNIIFDTSIFDGDTVDQTEVHRLDKKTISTIGDFAYAQNICNDPMDYLCLSEYEECGYFTLYSEKDKKTFDGWEPLQPLSDELTRCVFTIKYDYGYDTDPENGGHRHSNYYDYYETTYVTLNVDLALIKLDFAIQKVQRAFHRRVHRRLVLENKRKQIVEDIMDYILCQLEAFDRISIYLHNLQTK